MIDRDLAGFLEQGLGIHIGTRDEHLQPNGARAIAVKVEPDGKHLVVHAAQAAVARILPDLEASGQAAVSFGRPEDERACQVKGTFVGARPTTARERPFVEQQWEGYMRQLEGIGIPRAGMARWSLWPAVAVRLKVTAVFEQTPGPQAGATLA
jgi:hypothetical protein